MIEQSRRGFITGLISFAATAPAIVRATSLMPVKAMNWREVVRCGYVVYLENRYFWIGGTQLIKWSEVDPTGSWE